MAFSIYEASIPVYLRQLSALSAILTKAAAYSAQLAATVTRVCRKQGLTLKAGMTPRDLARCIEMAINGTKSAYPAMQPAAAFLKDLEIMLRTLVAGATAPRPRPVKAAAARKSMARSTSRKFGDRR